MDLTAETQMMAMTLDASGVVVVVERNTASRHTADSAEADIAAFRSFTNNQALPIIWDVRQMSRPRAEAWRVLLGQISELVTAVAFLGDSGSRTILGAFPEAIDSLLLPTRVFDDFDDAYEWINQFVPADWKTD